MHLLIAAIGRLKKGPEQDLVSRYADRIKKSGKSLGITKLDMIEIPESRGATSNQRKDEEAATLHSKLPTSHTLICFDERGARLSSPKFASIIETALNNGTPALVLVVGGPDGLSQSLRDQADHVVSFGSLTMPHQLVRALVLEQAYRATTILAGHPYHRV